jgi:alkyl hydroperoxide reductase subunit AhpC
MALTPQMAAPDFTATAVTGPSQFEPVTLSDYQKAGQWVVLWSFPLAFTFVCPTEIVAFSDAAAEFEKINTKVMAWSVDSPFSLNAWTMQSRAEGGLGPMKIPLISDLVRSF